MDEFGDVWVTSLVALATALLVALWNVGGWAALQRRAIRQELEIAQALRPGRERQRLEQIALERATLYVHGRTFIGPTLTSLRRLTLVTLILPIVVVWSWTMTAFSSIFWVMADGAVLAFSGLLGFWATRGVRLLLAWNRRGNLEQARAQLIVPVGGPSSEPD